MSLYTYNMTGLPSCTVVDPSTSLPGNETSTPVPGNTTELDPSPITNGSLIANFTTVIDGATTVIPVYTSTVDASVTTSAISSSSATAAPSPTSTAPVHQNDEDESQWYSLGCAVDSDSPRILTGYSEIHMDSLSVDQCLTLCESKGFTYAGLEYGEECYCGDSLPTTIAYSDSQCDMTCSGDSTETCGGDWRIELYELISSSCDNSTSSSAAASASASVIAPSSEVSATASPVVTASSSSAVATESSSSAVSESASATVSTAPSASASTTAPSSSDVPQASGDHVVWAHHMVGNTYPYALQDWRNDIDKAHSYGIDGFALNMGSDYWQPARIADAYSAAQQSGTGFKLFLSLDMTVIGCGSWADASALVNLVKRFADHPNQALRNGKVLVSTFAGSDCTFGTGSMNGWQGAFVDALQTAGVDIFFVPSIFTDPSTFKNIGFMDGELNWNSAWPMGSGEISTATDWNYLNQMGGKEYMAAISPFFFTHFGANSWNKNWLYRSDNWLYATRWEQLISMRSEITSLEILTWNDYGESSYIGPIAGALPAGSDVWVNGFDHEAINVLTKYYATAFKTGAYPTITKDSIVMWQRPHAHDAIATNDGAGRPTGWNWTDDELYAVVLTTGAAEVTLTSGSNTQTFSVQAGLTKLKIPSSPGSISGSIARSGSTVASYSSGTSVYTNTPTTYNYNYFLGGSS